MHKARSGLAAAAARWQLVDAPEGESSLQSRLQEAERRAQDAEAAAQDAQAALTRTLLDAARVEAVVTARIRAQSDAEIDALRTELQTMKQATSADDCAAEGDDVPERLIVEADRPDRAQPADVVAGSRFRRILPPARIAFLAVVGVVAVISFFGTTAIMDERAYRSAAARGSGPDAVEGVLRDIGADPVSVAAAAAALDAEMDRLEALSRKVQSLRTVLAAPQKADGRRTAGDIPRAGAQATSDANWLLYMPVEREALVPYLAGRRWPGIQMAAQPGGLAARPR